MTSERVTGTRNKHYDLISILYHVLQEAETIQHYIDDATREGDDEVAEFLKEVQESDRRRAERAKQLLGSRLSA